MSQARLLKSQETRAVVLQRLSAAQQTGDEQAIAKYTLHAIRSYCLRRQFSYALRVLNCVQIKHLDRIDPHLFPKMMYYRAYLHTLNLDYNIALDEAQLALRIASQQEPSFMIFVQRLIIIITLLLGQTPQRALFNDPYIVNNLSPYYLELTQAIRTQNIEAFNTLLNNNDAITTFKYDNVYTLVLRLRPALFRSALQRLFKIYDTITLERVQKELLLTTLNDAHAIVTKAIADNIIPAYIDNNDCVIVLTSLQNRKQYENKELRFHLTQRIQYCQSLTQQLQQSIQFPSTQINFNSQAETAGLRDLFL